MGKRSLEGPLIQAVTYDLWDETKLDQEKARQMSKKRQKKEPHLERAVKLPHPGQSYNPALEDHQQLLAKVAKEEVIYLKKEERLKKEFSTKVSADELERDEHNEMVSGIQHLIPTNGEKEEQVEADSDDFCSDYDEADFEAMLKDRTVEDKRKTNQQRMRQLKDKLQRKRAKLNKIRNIRMNKFNQLKRIKKQLDEEERLSKLKRRRLTKKRQQRFGQKFEPSDPIFCLPSELPSNLRLVKCPVDAMLRERMESFQARNLVEPTSVQMRRLRYPKKKFERRDADNKLSDDLQFEDDKINQAIM